MTTMREAEVAIVGGGLVGAAIGYGLARSGARVLVLDGDERAPCASRGNFGLVWVQGKGEGCPAYARWTLLSADLWHGFARELEDATGIAVGYSRPGGVVLALSEVELAGERAILERIRREAGDEGSADFEILDRPALVEMLPGLGPEVVGGTYSPADGHANPLFLLRALRAGIAAHGGRCRGGRRVAAIEARDGGFRVVAREETVFAERIVLAAGLGTGALAGRLGVEVPLAPQHGQLLVTERVHPLFDIPTDAVRQTREGSFLIGYSHNDFGFDTAARPAIMRNIARRAVRLFPFLGELRVVRSWGALRVLTPDGLPIYQESARHPGAFVATCHSGVTLAAAHALRLAPWIAGGALPDGLDAFAAGRFDVRKAG